MIKWVGMGKRAGSGLFTFTSLLLAACVPQSQYFQYAGSGAEQAQVSAPAFDPINEVDGIAAGDGHPSENLRVKSVDEASAHMVQDCSLPVTLPDGSQVKRYDFEREEALRAAEADPEQKTVPVEYAVSFGQKEDGLAYWAHKRAILSGSNPGMTYIPVGLKNGARYYKGSVPYHAYYQAEHTAARSDYIYGRRCFFNTVKLTSDLKTVTGYYDFIAGEYTGPLTHSIHYMYYGYCGGGVRCAGAESPYGVGAYGKNGYPNRLFDAWPHLEKGRPQIVKLYVANLRDGQFRLSTPGHPVVRLAAGAVRGVEMPFDVKEQLDLKTIFRQRDEVVRNLSSVYLSPSGVPFAGLSGVPQLLSNLQAAAGTHTLLPSQYTPLVFDLGKPKVKFSSLFGGTYFNMSAKAKPGVSGPGVYDNPHKTSWLGGDLVDKLKGASNPDNFLVDVRRETEDGFLVLPDGDGQVRSSRNLFGDSMEVKGKKYANGFEALRALSKKGCDPDKGIKDRYFGPWDGSLYSNQLKTWIDKNRNGMVDSGELLSLKNAGIVAVNTCYVLHVEEQDSFGNGTSMRSAFLYQDGEDITGNEKEILDRIATGKKSDGSLASFRLAIDVIFRSDEDDKLDPATAGASDVILAGATR